MFVADLPAQHIIPVNDERLDYPPDATNDHRTKINSYNEMLEDIFHRELELAKLKASLVDMKYEIVEEAQTLDPTGQVILISSLQAGETADSAASSGEEALETDSASGDDVTSEANVAKTKSKRRRGSKGKSKGKGREGTRKEEMGANWDYNLNFAGGARRAHLADEEDQ